MARKKKVNCTKRRVRFLSLDYYRNIVTGKQTNILGINSYVADDNRLMVNYSSGLSKVYFVHEGEKQLKQVIKVINAYIGGTGDGAQQF